MSLLSNLFFAKKRVTLSIDGLGEFTYHKDRVDEYWKIEKPVGNLPVLFDFGAISGSREGPNPDALEKFRYLSKNVEELYGLVDARFFQEIRARFGELHLNDVRDQFFIKSLTCSSKDKFEFGLHAYESDVFLEFFYRNGTVTEVHIDEGCCECV